MDYDTRSNNYLASLRKLFEEFRLSCEQGEIEGSSMHEINGDAVFVDHIK